MTPSRSRGLRAPGAAPTATTTTPVTTTTTDPKNGSTTASRDVAREATAAPVVAVRAAAVTVDPEGVAPAVAPPRRHPRRGPASPLRGAHARLPDHPGDR
ncbi:hypothetical protein NKG05_19130 [Oerskovia sp. M15]